MVIPEVAFDFKEVKEGTILEHNFKIHNKGEKPLEIKSVKPGWGCTVVRFDRTIPAGGEGNIHLKVKTSGFSGNIQKKATILTNDPKSPKSYVTIKAKVKSLISVTPRTAILRGFKDEQITKELTIQALEDIPLQLSPIDFSLSDKATYLIETVEKDKIYHIVFTNKWKQEGKYRGVLKVKTSYPEKPMLRIGIYGDIMGSLQLAPERIFFGRLDIEKLKASGKKFLFRSLAVKSTRKNELRIEKIDYNRNLFEANIREVQKGRIYSIELKLDIGKMTAGKLSEKLTIYTNLEDQPMKEVEVFGDVI